MASVSLQSQPCLPCMSRIQRAPSLPGHLEGVTDPQLRLGRSPNTFQQTVVQLSGTRRQGVHTMRQTPDISQGCQGGTELHTAKGAPHCQGSSSKHPRGEGHLHTVLSHSFPFLPLLFRTHFAAVMESTRSVSACLAVGNGSGLTFV